MGEKNEVKVANLDNESNQAVKSQSWTAIFSWLHQGPLTFAPTIVVTFGATCQQNQSKIFSWTKTTTEQRMIATTTMTKQRNLWLFVKNGSRNENNLSHSCCVETSTKQQWSRQIQLGAWVHTAAAKWRQQWPHQWSRQRKRNAHWRSLDWEKWTLLNPPKGQRKLIALTTTTFHCRICCCWTQTWTQASYCWYILVVLTYILQFKMEFESTAAPEILAWRNFQIPCFNFLIICSSLAVFVSWSIITYVQVSMDRYLEKSGGIFEKVETIGDMAMQSSSVLLLLSPLVLRQKLPLLLLFWFIIWYIGLFILSTSHLSQTE